MSWENKKNVLRIFNTFKRLKDKIYHQDIDALKEIDNFINQKSKQNTKDNLIYAKILALYLKQNIYYYKDIRTAIKSLAKELKMPFRDAHHVTGHIVKLAEDKSIDFSFTSPPYNRKRNDKYQEFNDINGNWFEMNVNVINELLRVTKNHVIYNIQANYYNRADVYKLIGLFNKNIVDIYIWEKSNPMPASGKVITNAVEYFIVLGYKSLKSNKTYTKNIITTSVNSSMTKEDKAVM